jgi:myb proto-oncogene protein
MTKQQQLRAIVIQHRAVNPPTPFLQNNKIDKTPAQDYFFVADDDTRPEPNVDAKRVEKYKLQVPKSTTRKWTKKELLALQASVRSEAEHVVYERTFSEHSNNAPDSGREITECMDELSSYTVKQFEQVLDELDWNKLGEEFNRTTGNEVEKKYRNELSSHIDNSKLDKEQEKQLLTLAQKHYDYDWLEVAKKAGSGARTPSSLLAYFQRRLNPRMINHKWSKEEDKKLQQAVEYYGKDWSAVATSLVRRHPQQCLHRYEKVIAPEIRKARWTVEEDKLLFMAVHAYAKDKISWTQIQHHIPGRTDIQCRERWCNVLNPELNAGPWTTEEDQKLVQAIATHGVGNWSKIAKELSSRTDNQCWRRWKALHPSEDVIEYQQKLKQTKAVMVKNFVGRKEERPLLSAEDIIKKPKLKKQVKKVSVKKAEKVQVQSSKQPRPAVSQPPTTIVPLSQNLKVKKHKFSVEDFAAPDRYELVLPPPLPQGRNITITPIDQLARAQPVNLSGPPQLLKLDIKQASLLTKRQHEEQDEDEENNPVRKKFKK